MSQTGMERMQRGLDHSNPAGVAAALLPQRGRDAVRLSSPVTSRALIRAWLIVGAAMGMVLTTQAQPAHAGTYEMWNCNAPGRPISLLHPWQPTDWLVPNVSLVDACATGGGWAVNFGGARQVAPAYGAGVFLFKPTGSRSPITFVKVTVWYSARLAGSGQPTLFMLGELRPDGFYQEAIAGPPGAENAVAERDLRPDTTQIQLALRCGNTPAETQDSCVAAHGVPLLIRGIKLTLGEDVPPIVLRHGGTLLEDGPQSGIRTVTYAASDAQSGLSKIDVLLDGVPVASNDLTTRCSHSDFTACPPSEEGTLQVDTRQVANGRHQLTLRAWDAAGNAQDVRGDRAVVVANEPSPTPTDVSAYKLTARFTRTSRAAVAVPYGRRISVRGRLTRSSRPVPAGSMVEVLERTNGRGSRDVRRARARTNADGSFSVVLATTRPSRTIRVAHRPTADSQIVSPALKLRVRAASRVRASLRGSVLRFSGRVLSAPVPTNGKRIVMEGRSPGSAWTPFKNLRTDRQGRFSGTYRLRVRRPGVRLKVRAVVPSEAGYGYLGSRSRALTLRVR